MAVNRGDSFRIDIDRLESSIKDMMPHHLPVPPKCCIFKTPVILKRHNEKAFIPDAFSIGPLHHGNQNLKATEKIKAEYLQGLISGSSSPDTKLRTLISSIMKVEKEARECYAEAIHYNPEQLVQILVIDGCFLIQLFRKKNCEELKENGDPIFSRSCMLEFLYHDLILLENQVPWMVLEILFNLTQDSSSDMPLFRLAMNFFEGIYFSERMNPWEQVINIEGIKHFVDLKRKLSILSYHEEKEESIRKPELLPSATSLMEAGIKFKMGTSHSIMDIKFIDGVLEIPPFQIDETTETIFRNLISYEQCHPNCDDKITSYAILLDSLINTAEDIEILCDSKIINKWLNSEDAAQLFNKLYHDTYVDHYYYTDLCRRVNSFCRRSWPSLRAVLVRDYFNAPWVTTSKIAGAIIIILTVFQTVYTIKK